MNKQPTVIRTYLLRGVFSLSLAFVIAIPMARGQSRNLAGKQNMNTSERTLQVAPPGARRLPILPMPQAPQVVLYDQYNNGGPNATRSTSLTDLPTFSTDLADDFVVPAGQTWNVQSIDADGTYNFGSGPATDWNVFIYTDNAGLPDTLADLCCRNDCRHDVDHSHHRRPDYLSVKSLPALSPLCCLSGRRAQLRLRLVSSPSYLVSRPPISLGTAPATCCLKVIRVAREIFSISATLRSSANAAVPTPVISLVRDAQAINQSLSQTRPCGPMISTNNCES